MLPPTSPRVHTRKNCADLGQDRAAVIATALRQILATAHPDELQRRLEDYLQDELADMARQIVADRGDGS